jgi:sulfatase maturation enzyme AslB (radical SAM superfamily)
MKDQNNISTVEITSVIGCKMRCKYCPQDKLMRTYAKRSDIYKMTFDIFKSCLDKIPPDVHIHFSGMAEPWLNPECTKMILYTHQQGYEISVYTTAVGMHKSDVKEIEFIPFRHFNVHLADKERYSKIDITNNYLETINAIINSKIPNREYMTMGKLHPQVQQLIKKRISRTKMLSRAGNLNLNAYPPIPPRLKGPIHCRSAGNLFNHNVLLPNGDVLICCMDYRMQHILGNLISSDYASLFKGNEFFKLQKGLDNDSIDILCRHCENASALDEYNSLKQKNLTIKMKKLIKRFIQIGNQK